MNDSEYFFKDIYSIAFTAPEHNRISFALATLIHQKEREGNSHSQEYADLVQLSKKLANAAKQSCGEISTKEKNVDKEIVVPLDLSDEVILALSKEAHEQNITLNQLMINIIQAKVTKTEEGTADPSET